VRVWFCRDIELSSFLVLHTLRKESKAFDDVRESVVGLAMVASRHVGGVCNEKIHGRRKTAVKSAEIQPQKRTETT
jgi:hypothetical protein